MEQEHLWWQTGIIYHIYPRSFYDSNGDGIGDLQGILQKLEYLQWLGVTAVWISPVYPSPMADFGYDISDYTAIHPLFGTMEDFDRLVAAAHQLNLRVIIDLVPNHTSDQHPWFLESRQSKDSSKRDWYIWHDATPEGKAPNNWRGAFGGSGWEWDKATGQYYFHSFLKEQPDLNWRNPDVERAFFEVMQFWLGKGVDGFRMDVLWHLIKDKHLRDNPLNPNWRPYMGDYDELLPVYSTDQPEVHVIVRKMRRLMDAYPDRLMIGEIYLPVNKLVAYYGTPDERGAHLPYNFQLIFANWNAETIAAVINEYEGALSDKDWPNWVMGNHDQPRMASRLDKGQVRIAAMLLLTLRGTPTIYYGDEIGMTDVPIRADKIQDPQGRNMPEKNLGRDPARTPMQWTADTNAGFTSGTPWLEISRDYKQVNIEAERQDQNSLLHLYRRLIALRQREPSLMYGRYIPVYSDHQVMAYLRSHNDDTDCFLVVLNISHRTCRFHLPPYAAGGVIEAATYNELEQTQVKDTLELYGDEGIIIRIRKAADEARNDV